MKKLEMIHSTKKLILIAATGVALVAGAATLLMLPGASDAESTTAAGGAVYLCPMHPAVQSGRAGICPECGMNLELVVGSEKSERPLKLSDLYTCPDHFSYLQIGAGKHAEDDKELAPLKTMPYVVVPKDHQATPAKADADGHKHQAASKPVSERPAKSPAGSSGEELYTCGMHPEVIQKGPGICPICNMNLVPLKKGTAGGSGGERRIAYWVAPMDPNYISDKPGKSPMGMDLVPVYEDELKSGVVQIDPATVQSMGVTTASVQRRDLSVELRTNGTVMMAENAEYRVNPKFSGWIEKLLVNKTGELVKRGQPLMEIYSPDLVSAQQEYLLAARTQQMSSRSKLPEVRGGAADLMAAARRKLQLWDISDEQINRLANGGEVQRTMQIVSPADGVVMEKMAVEGAAVMMGMDLFHIADLSTVWVFAQVYEYELPWLEKGASVDIVSPYDPDFRYRGRVDFIYPYLDAATRTAKVRIVVPNRQGNLLPEMFVTVQIAARQRTGVIAVDKSSVIRSGKRDIVFLALGDGRFIPQEVKLGVETDDWYEVAEGLTPGLSVVTGAQFLLDSEARLQEAIARRLQAHAGH